MVSRIQQYIGKKIFEKKSWIFLGICFLFANVIFAQSDTVSPVLKNVEVTEVSENSATIKWLTDELADSIVNYSLTRDFGVVRNPKTDNTKHEVLLDNLNPSTTYFFRVRSTDLGGNQAISGDLSFTTSGLSKVDGIEKISSPEERARIEKILAELQKIGSIESLALIAEKLKEIATGLTDKLTIIGPPAVEVGTTTATITWVTDRDSDSSVRFSPENLFSNGDYAYVQSSAEGESVSHIVELIGLEPFTVYHYSVVSKDQFGIVGSSEDRTFTTKALVPDILNSRIIKVEETSATFQWDTTIPSPALIEYEDLSTGEKNSIGSPVPTSSHLLKVSGLRLGVQYSAVIVAENQSGSKVRSDPIYFITVKDESAPIISKVSNESTIFPGAEARIQTIITWQTDEPSQCQFYYKQGLASTEELSLPPQDNNFLEKHIQVVVDFTPSTVYQFRLACKDGSGNESRSEDFVLFTPEKEKSIIDIILENFEGTFGWVKDIAG